MVMEALLLNRDAGAVRPGDPVVVKLEAFPFTRYGTLLGEVEHVSPDAVIDQGRGLVFPVRIRITASELRMDGERGRISPGMAATAEIATGTRRVADFILSPVARAASEAGRGR